MNTISLDFTTNTHRGFSWSGLKQRLTVWWHNTRSRSELESLSDTCLQDIGISRCTAEFEAAKPFWLA